MIAILLLCGYFLAITCDAKRNISLQARIVRGFNCHPRLVPYLASVEVSGHMVFCGGSLLHPYWALTAAHCCNDRFTDFKVYTGLNEMTYKAHQKSQSAVVKRMIANSNFSMHPWSSDICLLELETPLQENEHSKFIRLPTPQIYQQLMEKSKCNMSLAMGFGYRNTVYENYTAEPEDNNKLLQCVFQSVMSDNYCAKGQVQIDHDTILCAHGAPVITADTCQGDSGGPLICQGYQVGIVAAGIGCGLGYRSYFTKVAPFYYDFIKKYVPLYTTDSSYSTYSRQHLQIILILVCLCSALFYILYMLLRIGK